MKRPLLLSVVITLAGYQTGQAIQAGSAGNKSGERAGDEGGSLVKQGATSAAKKGK